KTKEKVLGEVYLVFTCYNLKRLVAIFGFEALIDKIKAILVNFLTKSPYLSVKNNHFKLFFSKRLNLSINQKQLLYI
ncbi:hypothetical protein Q4Q35_09615, partial [Flavivirga aquimarina]